MYVQAISLNNTRMCVYICICIHICADRYLGCAWVGEVKDRNQAENRPKYASKSQHWYIEYLRCILNTLKNFKM